MSDDLFCDVGRGIRLCYAIDGPADGPAVLLIAGLGLDLTSWHPSFVGALTDAGLRVIRFDNRDSGRSTFLDTRPPGTLRQLLARPKPWDYTLEDMGEDAAGLLDHLRADAVHVVGMSLGGMIAQVLAASQPERVRSLVSIFSTTGDRRVGQPARSTLLRMAGRPSRDDDEYARRHLRMLRHIGSAEYRTDPVYEREWARRVWQRRGDLDPRRAAAGTARQIAAINRSGDRTASLGAITAPTLVIHGDRDRMVHPTGGAATAAAIGGARLVTLEHFRHNLPAAVTPLLAPLVVEHVMSAEAAREPTS